MEIEENAEKCSQQKYIQICIRLFRRYIRPNWILKKKRSAIRVPYLQQFDIFLGGGGNRTRKCNDLAGPTILHPRGKCEKDLQS